MTTDPEAISLMGLLKGLEHFEKKGLTFLHLRVFLIVGLIVKVTAGRGNPQDKHIGRELQIAVPYFRPVLNDLIEGRYLHEVVPIYGSEALTYKLGSTGGILLKAILSEGRLKPSKEPQYGKLAAEAET